MGVLQIEEDEVNGGGFILLSYPCWLNNIWVPNVL